MPLPAHVPTAAHPPPSLTHQAVLELLFSKLRAQGAAIAELQGRLEAHQVETAAERVAGQAALDEIASIIGVSVADQEVRWVGAGGWGVGGGKLHTQPTNHLSCTHHANCRRHRSRPSKREHPAAAAALRPAGWTVLPRRATLMPALRRQLRQASRLQRRALWSSR